MTQQSPPVLQTESMPLRFWQLTWPMLLGIGSLMTLHLADAVFVARLGEDALATLSFLLPFGFVMIGVHIGLSVAISARVSRAIGAGDRTQAACIIRTGVMLTVISSALVVSVGWFGQQLFLDALDMPTHLQPMAREWLVFWAFGSPLSALQFISNSQLRASGYPRSTGSIMISASLINIVLDPIFIFGIGSWQGLGLAGSALASLLAWLITGSYSLALLYRKGLLSGGDRQQQAELIKPLLQQAVPAIATNMLPPLANALLVKLTASFGTVAVAAMGAQVRLEFFLLLPVLAMTTSLPVIIGQELGKNNPESARKAVWMAWKFALLSQLAAAVIVFIGNHSIAGWLVDHPDVRTVSAQLLAWLPWSYGMLGVCMLSVSALGAWLRTRTGLLVSSTRLFVLLLPLAWLSAQLNGFDGQIIGMTIANIAAGSIALLIVLRVIKQEEQQNSESCKSATVQ